MTFVPTYLWKEWRDHRAAIVAFALIVAALLVVAFTAIPGRWAVNPMLPTIAAYCGFAIAALAFGADVVPGESRRGRLGFLARLPGDLRVAFAAKLAFFVLALIGFSAFTYACTSAASALLCGGPWLPSISGKDLRPSGWIGLAAASWLFVVGCWLPRGTLALPAMVLAVAAFSAPAIAAFVLHPGLGLAPRELERALQWLAASGVVVAAVSFIGGLRHGGSWRRRLVCCVGSAAVAFVPIWGWSAQRVARFCHLDPSEPTFRLAAGAIGPGGRFAFVNGFHDLPASWPLVGGRGNSHALVLDLEEKSWREAGAPGDAFYGIGRHYNVTPWPLAVVADGADARFSASTEWKDACDGATGRSFTGEQWKALLRDHHALDEVMNRSTGFIVLPDGRHAWTAGFRVFVDGDDGAVGSPREFSNDPRDVWVAACGHGFVGSGAYFDCTRERTFVRRNIPGFVKAIRAGRWVVEPEKGAGTVRSDLALYDPDSGELSELKGLASSKEQIVGVERDGRLLVYVHREADEHGVMRDAGLVRLEPESGAREPLALPDGLAARASSLYARGFTADGDRLFSMSCIRPGEKGREYWAGMVLLRLDATTSEIRSVGPFEDLWTGILGCPDRDTVVLVDGQRRILRAHFDERPTETLFPFSR